MQKNSKTRILVECALIVALTVVLELIPMPSWPNGGKVTFSMIPVIFLSYRYGSRWGLLTGFATSLIQMIIKFDAPPTPGFASFFLCVLLDYVLAFTLLGAANLVAKFFSKKIVGYTVGALAVTLIRFCCSFLSGMLIWGSYAPEGQPVWLYSLLYNGGYMLPNMAITALAICLLCLALDPVTLRRPVKA
ncbi:MAG: energy-coupled thiamine transporter ThiT [Oscillospiraceae bacterium]|nr:energy-coupled thiamine transporter ThiT [Oscillospiraceae bacterium]